MFKIAVIYHSGFGHTKVIAEHIHQGAQSVKGIQADLISVDDIPDELEYLNQYDSFIFGAPTYMGSVSAPFKAFMEKTSALWFTQSWKNKLAAGFTNSLSMSGDKQTSLIQLVTFSCQHGMLWLSLGVPNESVQAGHTSGELQAANRIGGSIGLMTQSDNAPPEQTPGEGDKKTATIFGERVADATLRWNEKL
jgi:NAD(P)H dehydrogenase (quinone)